jgi:hypothetical protein
VIARLELAKYPAPAKAVVDAHANAREPNKE